MSGATHTQIPIKQRLLHDRRQAKIIALAAVTAFTATLVALVLALGSDSRTTGTTSPAVQVTEPSTSQSGEPGTRYDGGPEEGTRGAVSSGRPEAAPLPQQEHPPRSRLGTTQSGAPITSSRYDGGPEEGTRGMSSSNAPSTTAAGVRFDGGPEEGSRGLGR